MAASLRTAPGRVAGAGYGGFRGRGAHFQRARARKGRARRRASALLRKPVEGLAKEVTMTKSATLAGMAIDIGIETK